MATAAIAPYAAAPTAAAPQAHPNGSVPAAELMAVATEQASAPIAEHQLKRASAACAGANAELSNAKLAKHAELDVRTESVRWTSADGVTVGWERIKEHIAKIIHAEQDLGELTPRKVRRQLEQKMGLEQNTLESEKAAITAIIDELLDEMEEAKEEAAVWAAWGKDHEHVWFAQLQQRFGELSTDDTEDLNDAALLDAARELAGHSREMDYCCAGLEALCVQAGAYAEGQALVGTVPRRRVEFAPDLSPPWAPDGMQSAWEVGEEARVALAASAIQAAWKGTAVRLALAEAGALYNFGVPAPPGHYCRIFGGKQIYDFAFCRNDGVAIPYSFKEVLVYSPLLSTTAPDVSQQAARNSETGAPADALTSPKKDKRIKGAAARKAAVAAAVEALRRAREAAVTAKKRVTVVRGVLYYNGSRALKDAEGLADPYYVPVSNAQGVCRQLNVRWLWPTVTKEMVETAFSRFGTIHHVVMEGPTWAPKTGDPVCERLEMHYQIAYITYSDEVSAVEAHREMQGFILIGASVPVEHPQKAMEVHFGSHRPFDDDYDPDDDDVPFGYGGSAAVSHIQDECMAHEEDMLAFEYDSGWGGQDEDDDDFAEDGGFF
jgi:hypothetical protein